MTAEADSRREDARWRASQAMTAFYQDQQLDLQRQKLAFDRAEVKERNRDDDRDFAEEQRQFNIRYGGGGGSTVYDSSTRGGQLGNIAENLKSKFSSKFTQEAFTANVNRLMEQGDEQQLADYIFSSAIDTISDSEARKKAISQYKLAKKLDFLDTQLTAYKAAGGDTGRFRGTSEQIRNKLGRVGDSDLAAIGIAIMDTVDELARDRTGAVLSESEETFYAALLPSQYKKAELNDATINGLKSSQIAGLNSALRFQLTGTGFDTIEPYLGGDTFEVAANEFNDEIADLEFVEEDEGNWFSNLYTNFWN